MSSSKPGPGKGEPIRPEPSGPAEFHFRRAWQLRKDHHDKEAAAAFYESLKHQPDRPSTHFNLALTHDRLGDGAAALTHARLALELFRRDGDPGKMRNAERLLNKLLRKHSPKDS
ncbi:MAG: hypothetical protein ACE5ER_01925 [Nitrospinaceae bacterium]